MKRTVFSLLGGFIIIAVCACVAQDKNESNNKTPTYSKYFNKDWANNPYWDDAKAEVAVYDAQRTVYHKTRNFEYHYITVAEEFNKKFRVKTDDYKRDDLYKVMKVNAFARIETENYPYHYLTSMFFYRGQPYAMDKMTSSSQEWCGNVFKEFLANPTGYQMHFFTYFDGEGDGQKQIPDNTLFEDQLNYTLRALKFKPGLAFDADVLTSQISNSIGAFKIYHAQFAVANTGEMGANKAKAWKVTVKLDADKTNTYYFAQAYPNILLKQQSWDGRDLNLKKTSRYAYWKH